MFSRDESQVQASSTKLRVSTSSNFAWESFVKLGQIYGRSVSRRLNDSLMDTMELNETWKPVRFEIDTYQREKLACGSSAILK